jgi:hypothetical protein
MADPLVLIHPTDRGDKITVEDYDENLTRTEAAMSDALQTTDIIGGDGIAVVIVNDTVVISTDLVNTAQESDNILYATSIAANTIIDFSDLVGKYDPEQTFIKLVHGGGQL